MAAYGVVNNVSSGMFVNVTFTIFSHGIERNSETGMSCAFPISRTIRFQIFILFYFFFCLFLQETWRNFIRRLKDDFFSPKHPDFVAHPLGVFHMCPATKNVVVAWLNLCRIIFLSFDRLRFRSFHWATCFSAFCDASVVPWTGERARDSVICMRRWRQQGRRNRNPIC